MKETLLVVESPAKAKTIGKYLGEGFHVVASVGHIRDLPKSNKDAVDIENDFAPRYVITPGKEHVVEDIRRLADAADRVLLATDPDREGEAIAWHIAEAVGLEKRERVAFHEITAEAVREAVEHPRDIDAQLVSAQEARRVLDRLVGYDLSGVLWQKVRYGLSAGRVQSPALRIIVEREREIKAFKPEPYWVISAKVETPRGDSLTLNCDQEPKEENAAGDALAAAKKGPWKVSEVKESTVARTPKPPFTTSTLQQAASTRLGISPAQTMRLAQKLYEAGHITYMRTDSPNLAKEAQAMLIATARDEFGEKYVSPRTYKTKSKSAQEAHEAIRPTNASKHSAGANDEQKKLYQLIRARALASQMADARIMRTKITATISNGTIPEFAANGSRVVFDGWLKADPDARGEDVELPKVRQGEPLALVEARAEGKETQPPSRYSEAGLVKELEKRGIGRPSTYAAIIRTLETRGYVEKQGRTLIPTHTGDVVSSFLEEHFAEYISDTFTAEMENELDEIAEGKREYVKTLASFYTPFTKAVKSKAKIEKLTNMGDAPAKFPCPLCKDGMVYKLSRTGRFMSCKRFPECLGARKEDGSEIAPPKEIGEPCPQCGDPSTRRGGQAGKLIEREGRFGRFIACSNYPKCKFVKQDPAEAERAKTGVACPSCQKENRAGGEMVERRGRFGPFFSCSNYPDCKNISKARPTGKTCPECGSLKMQGTKTIPERCSNRSCPMHNPHKREKVLASRA